MTTLVFDIGGTNIRQAVVENQRLSKPVSHLVPRAYHRMIAQVATMARQHQARLIVGGVPGPLNATHTKLAQSTHLPHWAGRNFKGDLERASGARVILENDCVIGALGEAIHGAGRGARIMAYIAFGTGIGGARIVDGRVDANAMGFEPGHHIIDWNIWRHRHPSAHPGDWESFVSGSGILIATGKRSEQVTNAAVWRQVEQRAAIGLINVAMFWSPDVIILGGSLMKKMSLNRIRKLFRKQIHVFPQPPVLKRARLGDYSGLYGAMALLKNR